MENEKNNIFIVGLHMNDRTPEEIAHEAAMKIVEITDGLMERQPVVHEKN